MATPLPSKISCSVSGLSIRGDSYFLRKMVNKIHIQKTLGKVSDVSLSDAEKSAIDLIDRVRNQGQFALEMRKIREDNNIFTNRSSTIRHIAIDMIAHGKQHGTKKTGNKPWKLSSIKLWNNWLESERMKPLIDQDLKTISCSDVEDWYVNDLNKGKRAATDNSLRHLIRLCNWAIGISAITDNPTASIVKSERRYTVPKRHGRLDNLNNEIGRFALTLTQYTGSQSKITTDTICHLLVLSLLTGRRTSELKSLEWSWINFDKRMIVIPGTAVSTDDPFSSFQGTKNRRDFVVPMARILQTLLHTRFNNGSPISDRFVFPGKYGRSPITDIRITLKHIIERAETKRIIPHDLRRTFGSICRNVGSDYYTTKDAMGHKINDITADYIGDMSMKDKRIIFQKVSDYVSTSMPVKDLIINGKNYNFSGIDDMEDDNTTPRDERVFHPDALELLMFPNYIWRKGAWYEHEGIADALPIAEWTLGY
jgi:integrase